MTIKSALAKTDLKDKRVFLRADLNVPLDNGVILSDVRLNAIKPTLNMILEKGGKIILATHIGRPQEFDRQLSTKNLLGWFKKNGYSIILESNLSNAYEKSFLDNKTIVLLENLRFFPEEKNGDPAFAQQLAKLGDFYINDAFGVMHRTHSSVFIVPTYFSKEKRIFGPLVEQELIHADKLQNPEHPFSLIIGGNKGLEKIPLISCLLPKIDTLLVCPALAYNFLQVEENSNGTTLVDEQSFTSCKKLLAQAKKLDIQILMPVDYIISKNNSKPFAGPFIVKKANELIKSDFCVSIGPETQKNYGRVILQSKTIFYNGLMGDIHFPESLEGIDSLFKAMERSKGYSIVAGGDSTAAVKILGHLESVNYLSTGGGALLAYLCNQKLPALEILI